MTRGTMRGCVAAAVDFLLHLVDEVDAVPGPAHMEDEAFAALLAVGHDVDAERFLLAQRHDGGVVLRLVEVLALAAGR